MKLMLLQVSEAEQMNLKAREELKQNFLSKWMVQILQAVPEQTRDLTIKRKVPVPKTSWFLQQQIGHKT